MNAEDGSGLSEGARALMEAFRAFAHRRGFPGWIPAGDERRHGEHRVMRSLALADERGLPGLRITELADELGVRPPTITTMVDSLERRGLAARGNDGSDRRAVIVSITAEGRALGARMRERLGAEMAALADRLGEAEARRFAATLGTVSRFMAERRAECSCPPDGKERE